MSREDDKVDERSNVQSEFASDFSVDQFKEALAAVGVSSSCNLCSVDNWFYYTINNADVILRWSYEYLSEDGGSARGLSYYTRACLNCGNMQRFARVSIQGQYRKLQNRKNSDG
ncbi:UNVERIFIED_ORG: hypothetical protein M2438_001926 [Methylobacterium sp. SuP10 SLI 274]|uniref:hypothetical protein n=1 Tax=Methylorubrum extorquens TaxID=408 RepID=UPI00209CD3DB|nr:hypothetical protein [Methylorubrum extorquens]MDF9863139.1 hypothetical protein [Methylorubrum pseudosasae]MDH6636751.1 hypothetical protein [Methylobacterium sp. SuP10 SLI 274]MDH6665928.1 hypothetical protein [Methylorubrum zatmanii]MCP1557842.1 hypothetical protein [Methylorubrum extorquens]MDF9791444.1 hypothetical protein [Methylorubrum extorquens]